MKRNLNFKNLSHEKKQRTDFDLKKIFQKVIFASNISNKNGSCVHRALTKSLQCKRSKKPQKYGLNQGGRLQC